MGVEVSTVKSTYVTIKPGSGVTLGEMVEAIKDISLDAKLIEVKAAGGYRFRFDEDYDQRFDCEKWYSAAMEAYHSGLGDGSEDSAPNVSDADLSMGDANDQHGMDVAADIACDAAREQRLFRRGR